MFRMPPANTAAVPDLHRVVQRDLVVRGTGFLSLTGAVVSLALMAFYPPTVALGDLGWALVVPASIISIVMGAFSLSLKLRPSEASIASSSFIGIAQIALVQWLAGGGKAPYVQLLLLPAIGSAASQSLRRCAAVQLAATAAAFSPLLYSPIDPLATVTEFSLLSVMALMTAIVIASTRTHRARLLDASEFANELAHVDPLTGMPNRRAFDETLAHGIEGARVNGTPLSLVLCDVDSFKHINDTLGHKAGDEVLKSIAVALSGALRRPDAAFRWAGDEFAVILSDTDGVNASRMAARLRESVKQRCARSGGWVTTIATGVAELAPAMTADELLVEADKALLDQKAHRGRVLGAA